MLNNVILKCLAIALLKMCSSAAQSDCELGLTFDAITRNNIAISWNSSCYDGSTTYTVELIKDGDEPCPKSIECLENTICTTSVQAMGCSVGACSNVTMKVTGAQGEPKSRSIITAPTIKPAEWKIESSDITENTLFARWGPPGDSAADSVSCATEATVVVTCLDEDGEYEGPSMSDHSLDVTIQNVIQLDIYSCNTPQIKFTVFYMSGEELTETKKEHTLDYTRVTTVAPTTVPTTASLSTSATSTSSVTTTAPTTVTTTKRPGAVICLYGGEIAGIVCGCIIAGGCIVAGVVVVTYNKKMIFFA